MTGIYCHPDNLRALMARILTDQHMPPLDAAALAAADPIEVIGRFGIRVHTSELCPRHPARWEFPKERIFEWERSDEPWARYFGFGREVEDRNQLAFFQIGFPR